MTDICGGSALEAVKVETSSRSWVPDSCGRPRSVEVLIDGASPGVVTDICGEPAAPRVARRTTNGSTCTPRPAAVSAPVPAVLAEPRVARWDAADVCQSRSCPAHRFGSSFPSSSSAAPPSDRRRNLSAHTDLSPGTGLRDRNEKLQKYESCGTIDAIVHVNHAQRQITAWLRGDGGWLLVERGAGEQLELSSIGVEVDVDALYDVGRDLGGP